MLHIDLWCGGTYLSLSVHPAVLVFKKEIYASTCLQLSDIGTNKVHGWHLASFHTKHLRLAGTNDAAKCCNYVRLHKIAQVQMNDVKWREPKNLCQIPQSSPVSKSETNPRASPSHSRATAATGRGTSTGAAAESPAALGARPRHGLRNVANCTWSVFQPKEICCTRSLVTPRKNGKVKLPCGSCNRLTQSK